MASAPDAVQQLATILMDAIATEERMADRLADLSREAEAMGVTPIVSLLSLAVQSHRAAAIEYRARLVAVVTQDVDCYGVEVSSRNTNAGFGT